MGEAKDREKTKALVTRVHFSFRELSTLVVFLIAEVKPANRSQRKRYETLFDELKADDIIEKIESPEGLKIADMNVSTLVYREITRSSMDYLRECLDAKTSGMQTLILGKVDSRIGKALEGDYLAPDEAAPNGTSTADKTEAPPAQ